MRIDEKIKEIETYLCELLDFAPDNFEAYINDPKTKAACERYFEKIIGAIIDLCFLIIKNLNLKIPEEDKQAFEILVNEKIIPKELGEKFKEAKGMRNVISHEYGNIDDELVFESITKELEKDVNELIKNIKSHLK